MRFGLHITAVALLCALSIGVTVPLATADHPATEGVYNYVDEDGVEATWTIRTTCTPDCVAHVTTSAGHGFAAPLVNGRPTATRVVPDGVTCPAYLLGDNGSLWDGGTWPVTVRQWWDPHRLTGEVDFLQSPSPCGIPDPHDTFRLVKVG